MLPDTDIGLNEFSNISVYHTLQFEGALVCSYHDLVPFEDFIRFHPRLRRPVRDPIRRTRRLADASVAKLLEAHPWLSPEDLQELKPQRVGRKKGRKRDHVDSSGSDASEIYSGEIDANHDAGDDPGGGDADDVDPAYEMDLARADIADLVFQDDLYFYIIVRGQVRDGLQVRGQARDGVSQLWCEQYSFQKSVTFNFSLYGKEGATMLAKEYCRRGTFFIRLYMGSAMLDFEYTPAHVVDCGEDESFVSYLAALVGGDRVLVRSAQIRNMRPTLV